MEFEKKQTDENLNNLNAMMIEPNNLLDLPALQLPKVQNQQNLEHLQLNPQKTTQSQQIKLLPTEIMPGTITTSRPVNITTTTITKDEEKTSKRPQSPASSAPSSTSTPTPAPDAPQSSVLAATSGTSASINERSSSTLQNLKEKVGKEKKDEKASKKGIKKPSNVGANFKAMFKKFGKKVSFSFFKILIQKNFKKFQNNSKKYKASSGTTTKKDDDKIPNESNEQIEFMSQIIMMQALKIRRLEERYKRMEGILPDYGGFEIGEEDYKIKQNSKEKKFESAGVAVVLPPQISKENENPVDVLSIPPEKKENL